MKHFETIQAEFNGSVVTLWLARPEVHNALNTIMIREILLFFTDLEEMQHIRMVIIRGKGLSFCSGADLREMKNSISLDPKENLKQSKELSDLFAAIFSSSKVVVAAVHGNVFGGGNGLVAAADLAYGTKETRFALSETRVGMAAASITPYLMLKCPTSLLKELIFTARDFSGAEAAGYGLLNQTFDSSQSLELFLGGLITNIQKNGQVAISASKRLVNNLALKRWSQEMEQIPEILANIRISPEAQEGFSAFLEKRKPKWTINQ